MADSYDIPTSPKAKKATLEAFPVQDYLMTDANRVEGLQHLCEGALRARDYQELATLANLAHRYAQLAHIIYQVEDVITHGGTRRRR